MWFYFHTLFCKHAIPQLLHYSLKCIYIHWKMLSHFKFNCVPKPNCAIHSNLCIEFGWLFINFYFCSVCIWILEAGKMGKINNYNLMFKIVHYWGDCAPIISFLVIVIVTIIVVVVVAVSFLLFQIVFNKYNTIPIWQATKIQ